MYQYFGDILSFIQGLCDFFFFFFHPAPKPWLLHLFFLLHRAFGDHFNFNIFFFSKLHLVMWHDQLLHLHGYAIYSNTPLPKDWVKSFTLQEQYKVKPTWYLEGSWTALHCTTEANIISVVVSCIADEMSSYCTNLMNWLELAFTYRNSASNAHALVEIQFNLLIHNLVTNSPGYQDSNP